MKLTVTVFFERRERKKQRLQSFFSLRPNAHFFPLPLPPAGLIIQQSSFPPISYYSLPLFLLPVLRVKEDVFEAPLAWPPTALGSSSLEGIRRDSLSIIQTGRARGPLGLRPLGGEALPYIPIPSTGVEHWLHRCVLGLQKHLFMLTLLAAAQCIQDNCTYIVHVDQVYLLPPLYEAGNKEARLSHGLESTCLLGIPAVA